MYHVLEHVFAVSLCYFIRTGHGTIQPRFNAWPYNIGVSVQYMTDQMVSDIGTILLCDA